MSAEALIAIIGGGLAILGLMTVLSRRPKRLDKKQFQRRWVELQRLCARPETWPLAVIDADKLLDDALKRSRFKGKTMGERLVAAQRLIKDNDSVWYGHKLRNKLVHEENTKLTERDVKQALIGYRAALRDLGGL
jgi:hypothetical protein